jgi:hypothetical protein
LAEADIPAASGSFAMTIVTTASFVATNDYTIYVSRTDGFSPATALTKFDITNASITPVIAGDTAEFDVTISGATMTPPIEFITLVDYYFLATSTGPCNESLPSTQTTAAIVDADCLNAQTIASAILTSSAYVGSFASDSLTLTIGVNNGSPDINIYLSKTDGFLPEQATHKLLDYTITGVFETIPNATFTPPIVPVAGEQWYMILTTQSGAALCFAPPTAQEAVNPVDA